MNSAYGSSVSFGSKVRSKYIVHNKFTGRIINLSSKPTPVHGPVHKSDLNYSYSRSKFSRLTQAVSKKVSKNYFVLSHKVSCAYMTIYPVNNGCITNEVTINMNISDHSIVTFGIRGLCIGFSKISHAGS